MNTMNTIWSRFALTALGGSLLLVGCGNETGIPQRHLQGVVTLPPLALYEAEPADSTLLTSTNRNDTLPDADGPFGIGFAYHIVRGHAHRTCDEVAADSTFETLCSFTGPAPDDRDFYRIRSQYQGPIGFEARPVLTEDQIAEGLDVDDIDIDIQIYDKQSAPIWVDSNGEQTELDENGEPVLDDEGIPRTFVPLPRNIQPVLNGEEFFVAVTVNADVDGVDYELVIIGNDPREHDITRGIEEDVVSFDFGETIDDPRQADYEIKVGAFLNEDTDRLGNPVGGTSCDTWTLDEESETFWCSWDMVFLHQVTVSGAALIPGMGDGKDNECNGTADTGAETTDADADGYTIADGDCNDTDPDIGPFRGDTWGDRKDNDCDGWADIGPDDVDNDGDGFCENGRDVNGDGVCRGPAEAGGLGGGDCNDTDPRISPAFNSEIPANGLDDDCADGDSVLDTTNSDTPNQAGAEPDAWTDLEELACGSNPNTSEAPPADADDDGLCDSECLGTVGCAQDWDGDGYHNWLEMQCNMDPEVVTDAAGFPDFDGDGECDGMDSDADNDGFEKKIGQDGTDCNDLNVSIHPHPIDPETDQIIDAAFNYDVADGVDNDCDGQVDENRDWVATDSGFAINADFVTADLDGDGFTLGQRDCDDTDATVFFGNWEVRTANVVSTDFSVVHLFAGEYASLNSTAQLPGSRTATETVPYDLQKGRVAWELTADWDNLDPPTLTPSNDALPRLDVWYAKQIEVGNLWFEAKDANGVDLYGELDASGFQIPSFPWADGTFQDLGDAAAPGKTNELNGSSDSVVPDTWEGDVDGYRIAFPDGGNVNFKLDWTTGIDLDMTGLCYYFDAVNQPNYYSGLINSMTDLSKPEEGTTPLPLPPGSDCYFFVVTYSGQPGPYTVEITVLED